MEIVNKIAKIRDKLDIYSKLYISLEILQKLLDKFAPNYTINQLCSLWLLTPIKKGKWYLNNKSKEIVNPFVVWDLYFWDELYVFWWISVYNRYGISEQIAEWYTIYNTKISWKKIIWNSKFIFVKQRESFFYWIKIEKFWEYSYKIMTPERAFIQALKEDKKFDKLPYKVDFKKLEKLAKKYASITINDKIKSYVY